MVDVALLKRSVKQQEAATAAFRNLDPEYVKGLRELAVEPLMMLERGDYEGAALHIKWLKLDPDDLYWFWYLFDSTQRAKMKEIA